MFRPNEIQEAAPNGLEGYRSKLIRKHIFDPTPVGLADKIRLSEIPFPLC